MSASDPVIGPEPPVTNRALIGNALYDAGWMPNEINHRLDKLLAEHAHELAEKQRAWADAYQPPDWDDVHDEAVREGARMAADLIDLQKEGQ